jgi:type IV secretion system protein VirB4
MERVGRTELPDKPLWLRERASLPDKERGDLGIVLRVRGVDYESLDQAAQEYAVKRLEAALKTFGVGFHVYQYLFKTNRPDIPFQKYEDPAI